MTIKADPNSLKKCAMCGEYKVRSEGFYYREKRKQWDSRCKECRIKVYQEYLYEKRSKQPPGKWRAKREAAPEGTKYCKRCDSYKPLDEFYRKKDGRYGSACKACLQKEHQETYVSRRKVPVMTPEEKVIAGRENGRRDALRRRGYSGPFHTKEEWQGVLDKYEHKCLNCGLTDQQTILTRDHVIPLSEGGSDTIDNIQPLCIYCNSRKWTKSVDYRPKA